MARFLWACWDGGGNVPPSVGIARRLREAGHSVLFAGRPGAAARIAPAGFRVVELESAGAEVRRYSWHPHGRLPAYLSCPVVADELVALAAREEADVVVVDAKFSAALAAAPRFGVPTAVMLHGFLNRCLGNWREEMRWQSEARRHSGFTPLPALDTLWGRAQLVQVNTMYEFDCAGPDALFRIGGGERVTPWPNVRYGGPVPEQDARALTLEPLWEPDGSDPLVVVSFSTAVAQNSVHKLQRTLDALSLLPVRVVATTASVDPRRLTVPGNARVVRFAAHDPLMREAALVITHGGHGTAMRALRHGASLLCLAGKAADQHGLLPLDHLPVAQFIEEHGVGCAVPADASSDEIRDAVCAVLGDAAYRDRAYRAATLLGTRDAAGEAAANLAALAPVAVGAAVGQAELRAY